MDDMQKLLIRTAVTLLNFAVVLAGCDNGTKSSADAKALAKIPAITLPEDKNFDVNVTFLPVSDDLYWTNASAIVTSLWKMRPEFKKTEYETTKEYKARIKAMGSRFVYDQVSLGGGMAFASRKVKYDADKEVVVFSSSYGADIGGPVPGVSVYEFDTPVRKASDLDLYHSGFRSTSALVLATNKLKKDERFVIEYKMPREKAKEFEGKLGVLFVGNPIDPYVRWEEMRFDGKSELQRTILPFNLTGIWFVNFKTGEILSKKYRTCNMMAASCPW